MKKIYRVLAMLMAAIMALSLITTAFAEPTIDPSKKASLSIYKYDITKASNDGAWNVESYVSTGLHDDTVIDKLAKYAIQGVEFTYLRVADIAMNNELVDGQRQVGVLYGFDSSERSNAVLSAIGLTGADTHKTEGGINYFTSDIVEWFASHGIEVWSVKEGEQRFDQHVDFLMNYIRFWQASGESKKTSIRTKTALEQLVAEGRFCGGIAPYGYKLEPSGILNKRKHEVMKLVIEESEACAVRLMFHLCVNSGYGRCRIASALNDSGLKNRDGQNWHEATVGHILHNVLYTGILRSGSSRSDVIPELQIVAPDTFCQAQTLMQERTNAHDVTRTLPRNTKGQALLSGNVRCGHCGGRLILTSSAADYVKADGSRVRRKRTRYICYNKVRKRCPCSGPTGYTAHILDARVKAYLRELFAAVKRGGISVVTDDQKKQLEKKQAELLELTQQFEESQSQYELFKNRLLDSIRQTDSTRQSMLTEVLDEAYERVVSLRKDVGILQAQMEELSETVTESEKCAARIMEWANIFEVCSVETQKMIAGYMLKCVTVFRDYRVDIQTNDLGIAIPRLDTESTEQT